MQGNSSSCAADALALQISRLSTDDGGRGAKLCSLASGLVGALLCATGIRSATRDRLRSVGARRRITGAMEAVKTATLDYLRTRKRSGYDRQIPGMQHGWSICCSRLNRRAPQ